MAAAKNSSRTFKLIMLMTDTDYVLHEASRRRSKLS